MVLFFINISTRRVERAGIKCDPDGQWMKQIARNVTDCEDGFLKGIRYLIHDRDSLYTKEFDEILRTAGIEIIKTPPCSPNLNECYSTCTPLVA